MVWWSEIDNERVGRDVLAAIEDRLPARTPIRITSVDGLLVLSEDGRPVSADGVMSPPLPEFDPRFLEELDAPGGRSSCVTNGTMSPLDDFWIDRTDVTNGRYQQCVEAGACTLLAISSPSGPADGVYRVIRGGSWNNPTSDVRVALRFSRVPDRNKDNNVGFRCVRSP